MLIIAAIKFTTQAYCCIFLGTLLKICQFHELHTGIWIHETLDRVNAICLNIII